MKTTNNLIEFVIMNIVLAFMFILGLSLIFRENFFSEIINLIPQRVFLIIMGCILMCSSVIFILIITINQIINIFKKDESLMPMYNFNNKKKENEAYLKLLKKMREVEMKGGKEENEVYENNS